MSEQMEFNEKLQILRKDRNMTQEELAEKLYVSRTAISKWESGRGMPNIESLKALSNLFEISIDSLLSSEEIMKAAEEEKEESTRNLRNTLLGLMDIMFIAFMFLPLFGEKQGEVFVSVALINLKDEVWYILISYFIIIILTTLFGIAELIIHNFEWSFWENNSVYISIGLTIFSTFLFIVSREPYVAFFNLWILIIKGVLFAKKR